MISVSCSFISILLKKYSHYLPDIVTKHLEIMECRVILVEVSGYVKASIRDWSWKISWDSVVYKISETYSSCITITLYLLKNTSSCIPPLFPGNHYFVVYFCTSDTSDIPYMRNHAVFVLQGWIVFR